MPIRFIPILLALLVSFANAAPTDHKSRIKGMLWGALVADAAALGAHWYYDQEDLKAQFPEGIRGFETPAVDHYHGGKKSGDFTMYGDALKLLIDCSVSEGGYSVAKFGEAFMKTMTPGNYAGYIDHATRESFEIYQRFFADSPEGTFDFQQGSDDNQMAGATSLMPIVLLHADSSNFYKSIEAFVKIRQNNAEAIAYCQVQAGILKALIAGASAEDAIEQSLAEAPIGLVMRQAIDARIRDAQAELANDDITQSTYELGYSCPLRGSFPASLFSFLKLKELSYEEAILSIIRAGGESAGRGMLVGAFLGALHGDIYIPQAWKEQLNDYQALDQAIDALID